MFEGNYWAGLNPIKERKHFSMSQKGFEREYLVFFYLYTCFSEYVCIISYIRTYIHYINRKKHK